MEDQKAITDEPRQADGAAEGPQVGLLLDKIIPYQINWLSHRMNRLLDQELRSHGLSMSSWRVMAVLDFAGAATVNELAHYAMIEQSTLSRMLQRMEAEGLLENTRSDRDGRVRQITMSAEGHARYDMVREITLKHTRRIVHGFSREERALLMRFIRRMQDNVETLGDDGTGG